MRKKYLLGVNNNGELVFGEFKVTERNGYPEFTASFNTVFPIGASIYDIRDCSLYSEKIDVDGITYYFESSSCGQHDTRKDGMKLYTNQKAYDKLHEFWDLYHLKKVDEEVIKEVQELHEVLSKIDEKEWIENWIKENIA